MSDEETTTTVAKKTPKARTSITVDKVVYEAAVLLAGERGQSFSSLIERLLREECLRETDKSE